jgi:hypothetical protein
MDSGQNFGLAGAISTLIFIIVGVIAYANFVACAALEAPMVGEGQHHDRRESALPAPARRSLPTASWIAFIA